MGPRYGPLGGSDDSEAMGPRVTLVPMTGSHAQTPGQAPAAGPEKSRDARARNLWRMGTPVMVLLCGALFVVSATSSEGTDLRPGRYTDLASLVQNESDEYERLQERAGQLKAQVDTLAGGVNDRQVKRKQRQAEQLRGLAGLDTVTGTGITVVLDDASADVLERAVADTDLDLDRYIVHQQDIQAVVNAMWTGGAAAITIQGQRIVTTTGIKCIGSSVQLQGVPYPPPYVISAVGDPVAMTSAIDRSLRVNQFRADALNPDIGVGWTLSPQETIEAPAYTGLLDITYAEPVGTT